LTATIPSEWGRSSERRNLDDTAPTGGRLSRDAAYLLDYYLYGSKRIPQTTGGFNEQKQYVGQY
jgi:hypothetical protein